MTLVPGSSRTGPPTGTAGGDLTGSYPSPTLASIGSAVGPIGGSSAVPVVTIDTKGRVTALTSASISFAPTGAAGGDLTGTYPNPTVAASIASQFTVARLAPESPSFFGAALQSSGSGGPNTDGRLSAVPIILARAVTVVELDVRVNVIGGVSSTCRVGIYADTGAFRPGALLHDAGTVATTGTGIKTITGLSYALSAGVVYWLVGVPQGQGGAAPQMYGYVAGTSNSLPQFGDIEANSGSLFAAAGAGINIAYYVSGISTTLPNPFGVVTSQVTGVAVQVVCKC